jgi:hypothetical protein
MQHELDQERSNSAPKKNLQPQDTIWWMLVSTELKLTSPLHKTMPPHGCRFASPSALSFRAVFCPQLDVGPICLNEVNMGLISTVKSHTPKNTCARFAGRIRGSALYGYIYQKGYKQESQRIRSTVIPEIRLFHPPCIRKIIAIQEQAKPEDSYTFIQPYLSGCKACYIRIQYKMCHVGY